MASVTGSRLTFSNGGQTINLVLTATGATDLNGNSLAGDLVTGDTNIEVFTSMAGNIAPGYDGSAFIQGAVSVASNEVQAGTIGATEQILQGSYALLDQFGAENIQIIGSGAGVDAVTVTGSGGDTISGSTVAGNTQLIDASNTNPGVNPGPETITGGAGNTTVWAAAGDNVTGGAGAITVAGNAMNNMTISGASGNLETFNFGTGNSVTGATTGTTFIDDNYGGSGNVLIGGGGGGSVTAPNGLVVPDGTYMVAGINDQVFGGSGSTLINAIPRAGSTITAGTGSDQIWAGTGESIIGSTGLLYVAGDGGGSDTITGGGGAATVVGGATDSVTAGTGAMLYSNGNTSTLTGGSGNLEAVNLGTGNDIGGATATGATTFIDDSYTNFGTGAFSGGSNTLSGGAGASTVIAGPGDTVNGGAGTLEAIFKSSLNANETVNLSTAASGVRDLAETTTGAAGTNVTVNGFSTATDQVESPDSAATLISTSTTFGGTGGGTVLHFADGSTMTLVGVTDPTTITFTH
ncbi:MAG TPA: hypothetical protein VND95_07725 [Stellaceae bacterium]|nr:hypothetical protein [Stellaceae bacterium]